MAKKVQVEQPTVTPTKVVAFFRASTVTQGISVEAQKEELLKYILLDGVEESNIIWVGGLGESAIKLDEEYLADIKELYSHLDTGFVHTVYCWELQRIYRKAVVGAPLIEYLKEHKINLRIKKDNFSLLDEDGTISKMATLAINIMTGWAEMEMQDKKERFARTFAYYAKHNIFKGGKAPLYGYKVVNKTLQPDYQEDGRGQADVVKMVFELYATGNYSAYTLAKELTEQGIKFTADKVHYMLINEGYCGGVGLNSTLGRTYIPIVSRELFEQCRTIAKGNNTKADKQYKHHYFGNKIMRCYKCGKALTANVSNNRAIYSCNGKKHKLCNNGESVSVDLIDGLLWEIASAEEIKSLLQDNQETKDSLIKEMEVLQAKLKAEAGILANLKEEEDKISLRNISGRLSDEIAERKYKEIDAKRAELRDNVLRWKEDIKNIENRLNSDNSDRLTEETINTITTSVNDLIGEERMSKIVHKYIQRGTIELLKEEKKKTYNITFTLYDGTVYTYYYQPNSHRGKIWVEDEQGRLLPYLSEPRVIRTEKEIYTTTAYRYLYRGTDSRLDKIVEDEENRLINAMKMTIDPLQIPPQHRATLGKEGIGKGYIDWYFARRNQ